MTFGERLKELRANAGLSQAKLARTAGVCLSTVCKIEQGVRKIPSSATAEKLAKGLRVNVGRLFGEMEGERLCQ